MPSNTSAPAPAGAPAADTRQPYLKPAFQHEPVFETMALACGKVNITQNSCRGRRNAS